MRLELFGFVLFLLLASSFALRLYDPSSGSGSGFLDVAPDLTAHKTESLRLQQEKNELLSESKKLVSSPRILSESGLLQTVKKKREVVVAPEEEEEVEDNESCDEVTEDEIKDKTFKCKAGHSCVLNQVGICGKFQIRTPVTAVQYTPIDAPAEEEEEEKEADAH